MEIVKFKDGKYAVRKGSSWTGYQYLNTNGDYWWSLPKHYNEYCKCSSKEVRKLFDKITKNDSIFNDKGTPVKW